MILSDRTIREQLAAGRIVIEPLDERDIQPSSVDLHIDRYFRVFRNHSMPVIDVKEDLEELTELIQIDEDGVFILHPGEFVLGTTLERVQLPDDLVARLEGKSSLGRLGLLIHSSLPGSEPVVVRTDRGVEVLPIEEVVRKQLGGDVVAFDRETFEVSYHPITGWYEGPPDRIFEVRLSSGRSVRVTAGHNLFTLDEEGELVKVRTGELKPGTRVAIPRRFPTSSSGTPTIRPLDLLDEQATRDLVVTGPTVRRLWHAADFSGALHAAGYTHDGFYRAKGAIPLPIARAATGFLDLLGEEDRLRVRGGSTQLPAVFGVTPELAWLLGLYIAEGYRRDGQVVVSNTDQAILDRAEAAFATLGLSVYRGPVALTCSSKVLSRLLSALGTGEGASSKRLPAGVLGWPRELLDRLLEGMMDGDGSSDATRDSYWTCSAGLASDLLLLCEALGIRAAAYHRPDNGRQGLFQVAMPKTEHKLLMSVPLPDRLLVGLRKASGITQLALAAMAGYSHATDLNNIERRRGRDAVRRSTLERLRDALRGAGAGGLQKLDRLVDGDVAWDEVIEVRDTGRVESIFDLSVHGGDRPVENFLAGHGGVLVSNTAGFVDAGWNGQLTLELSNVATLPITLYPGMKIGQISFLAMTTPADHPYGSSAVGSKYQNQVGPRPSRYFENFRDPA